MQKWLPLTSVTGPVSSTTNGATSKGNEIIHFSERFRYFWVKASKVLNHLNLRDLCENFTLAQLASFYVFKIIYVPQCSYQSDRNITLKLHTVIPFDLIFTVK